MPTNLEKKTKVKEEIIKIKLEKTKPNSNQKYLLENGIVGDNCTNPHEKTKEVYETLLNTQVREDGGRNALFGFYYQFLVAIDYLVELAKGKWSFMAFEIHDDIVLCKEDEGGACVRFVQVKTSRNPSQLYSSTELCTRTKKKFSFNNKEKELHINDSWLDKLFLNAELFEDNKEVVQQFQLVTNYSFYVPKPKKGSKTKNINHYRTNESFSEIDIKDDDPFLKKLQDPVFDIDGDEYIYDNQTGMTVRELLSKTQIFEQVDLLSSFRDGIRTRLGDMLSRKVMTKGGATVTDDEINWLIGEMIASCSARDDKLILFIDSEKAMYLESKLLEKSTKYSEEYLEVAGNKKHIDDAFQKTMQEVQNSNPEAVAYFEEIAVSIKQQFYILIKEERGNVLQLVSRFYEGREESIEFHGRMHKSQREESVYALVLILLLLNITNKEINFSSKHRDTLTKEVLNNLEEKYYLTLLKFGDNYIYEDLVKKLNEIVTRLHIHSKADLLLMTVDVPNKVIIHGMHDRFDSRNFSESSMEIVSLNGPLIPQLDKSSDSMNKVDYKFLLIPWYVIESRYARFRRDRAEFLEFKETLTEFWNKLSEDGE